MVTFKNMCLKGQETTLEQALGVFLQVRIRSSTSNYFIIILTIPIIANTFLAS